MGLFDSENHGYVPQHERLLQGISRKLWPLLGITAGVADALWAWVHFREVLGTPRYMRHSSPASLE